MFSGREAELSPGSSAEKPRQRLFSWHHACFGWRVEFNDFLFIGHPEAGQRSAVIYSVLGSCRRHGINPADYLQDVFERLPQAKSSEVPALTPAAWAKAKRAAARQSN